MITAQQAIKAAILCQYITKGLLPITVFRYYRIAEVIYIEAGFDGEIRIEVNKQGDFNYV